MVRLILSDICSMLCQLNMYVFIDIFFILYGNNCEINDAVNLNIRTNDVNLS